MYELPTFETSLVPGGTYTAEVIGEIQEKPSSFDKTKNYLELTFALKHPQLGEFQRFIWAFTSRSLRFADFLLAIGGRRLPNGNVQPPSGPYIGKKVILNVGQRTSKNDKNKIVNEVLSVFPAAQEPSEDGIEIPF